MKKYVFCDLDYTLLDNDRNVSKENLDAIKMFESKGNKFIICSGRVPFALKQYKELLNASEVISSNGAVILSNNEIIKSEALIEKQIIPITQYALDNHINVRYFTNDYMLLLNQEYASKKSFMYKENKIIDKNRIFEEIKNEKIIKLVLSSDDRNVLEKADIAFKEMNLDVEITFSLDIFLEINALNQNKGEGIKEYCKINSINLKDTISIGDNDNDLTMLKVTGMATCPSNAIDNVKKIADYVCRNDNNHNAVKEVLEKYL